MTNDNSSPPDKLSSGRGKTDPELLDRLDCLNKSMANLRSDFRQIVRDTVNEAILQLLKELNRPKKYVEVGYR